MPTPLILLIVALVALALPAGAAASGYVPGEVIVHYEDGTTAVAASNTERLTDTAHSQNLPGDSELLAIRDGDSVRATIAELEARPGVAYAVPNWRARAAMVTSDDPGAKRQWNLFGTWGVNLIEAWRRARSLGASGGRGATVAVLDSGVAYENRGRYRKAPDLRRSTFVRPYDFIDDDHHPNDSFGHGTHVSGTIAQTTGNGVATAGIAFNAKVMPLRVLDDDGTGDSGAIARAIRYAARHGADVINLSLEFPTQVRANEIPDVLSALRYARRHGSLVVAAAGNRAVASVAYPARASSVLAVAATTPTGCQAEYSNTGDDLDISAPGGGADASSDDGAWDAAHCRPQSFGRQIFQQTFLGGSVRRFGLPYGYEGTSMASPHVSAVAALVIASGVLGRDPSPRQVEEHLEATARPTDRPDRYGAGLIDAGAALGSPAAEPAR